MPPTITKRWSLGDAPPPGFRLVRERYELPKSRELIVEQLGEILAKNVQRVIVEVGKPIEVTRLAKESEVGPEIEDASVGDLYNMIRNAEVEEIPFGASASVLARITGLFLHVRQAGLSPLTAVVGDERAFRDWAGLGPTAESHLMGVPVVASGELPEDALILACCLAGETSGVDKSYRITLDTPEKP